MDGVMKKRGGARPERNELRRATLGFRICLGVILCVCLGALFTAGGAVAQTSAAETLSTNPDAGDDTRGMGRLILKSACRPGEDRAEPPIAGREALIVANQDYPISIGPLDETFEDGGIVCEALETLGFIVAFEKDLNAADFRTAVINYSRRLALHGDAAVGFFYFAGHGAALFRDGDNFLIPTGVEISSADELPVSALSLGDMVRTITGSNLESGTNFIVIDACRNVAFTQGVRSGSRGLAPIQERGGALVAFSTAPGDVAFDANYFSTALAEELQVANRPAYAAFRAVRRRVLQETNFSQFPWFRDGLIDEFVFRRDGNAEVAAPPPPPEPQVRVVDERPIFSVPQCPQCPDMIIVQPEDSDAAPFALAQAEVTFDDWERCVAAGGCDGYLPDDAGWGRGDRPVFNISYEDAQRYVQWLVGSTGRAYRLPTDTEWSQAAAAGATAWTDGGQTMCDFANGAAHRLFGGLSCDDGQVIGTRAVRSYRHDAIGVFDMAGNVWEWVDGCANGVAVEVGARCPRILRGGSWESGAGALGPEGRRIAPSGFRSSTAGFRIAMDWRR